MSSAPQKPTIQRPKPDSPGTAGQKPIVQSGNNSFSGGLASQAQAISGPTEAQQGSASSAFHTNYHSGWKGAGQAGTVQRPGGYANSGQTSKPSFAGSIAGGGNPAGSVSQKPTGSRMNPGAAKSAFDQFAGGFDNYRGIVQPHRSTKPQVSAGGTGGTGHTGGNGANVSVGPNGYKVGGGGPMWGVPDAVNDPASYVNPKPTPQTHHDPYPAYALPHNGAPKPTPQTHSESNPVLYNGAPKPPEGGYGVAPEQHIGPGASRPLPRPNPQPDFPRTGPGFPITGPGEPYRPGVPHEQPQTPSWRDERYWRGPDGGRYRR